jgi:hypothetical protein
MIGARFRLALALFIFSNYLKLFKNYSQWPKSSFLPYFSFRTRLDSAAIMLRACLN